MPSIFVWKATTPLSCASKKMIRYYVGSDWVLEDTDSSSHSYKYLQQIVIPVSDNDSVITFLVKSMPRDWIGSNLLEVMHVPYQLIRSDAYGTLEQIGEWLRFTMKQEVEFTRARLTDEFARVQQWMHSPVSVSTMPPRREQHRPLHLAPVIPSIPLVSSMCPQKVKQDFQEFYQKYATPPCMIVFDPPAPHHMGRGRGRGRGRGQGQTRY